MNTHVITMLGLRDTWLELELAQELINIGRAAHPMDQRLQLELDRRQASLNDRRIRIEITMLGIATLN